MRALVILLAVLLASPVLAWEAEVFRVSDGDTVTVIRTDTGEKIRVRLYGVDTPEGRRGAGPGKLSAAYGEVISP